MTAEMILNVARGELGTKESPPCSNRVKYNTAYYGREVSGSAYPWCMVFVWWVFKEAGASGLFFGGRKTAGCPAFMNWARKTGRWVTSDFQPGDIILYQFDSDAYSEHVGICESFDGRYLTCIEGNTGAASSADGGEVQRRRRSKGLVFGAYRPEYENAEIKGGTFEMVLNILKMGSRGNQVKALQMLLNGNGCGGLKLDGVFGSKTKEALKGYQTKRRLQVDGIAGPETWRALLK